MDPTLLDVFIFENMQLLDQLEETLLTAEKSTSMSREQINDVFRVMHTIKGASSMMEFTALTKYAHTLEDLFDYVRSNEIQDNYWIDIFDAVFTGIDYFKAEISKLQNSEPLEEADCEFCDKAHLLLSVIKGSVPYEMFLNDSKASKDSSEQASSDLVPESTDGVSEAAPGNSTYKISVEFTQGCGMETIRAMSVLLNLRGCYSSVSYVPSNLDLDCDKEIADNGFTIYINSDYTQEALSQKIGEAILVESIKIESGNRALPSKAPLDNSINAQDIISQKSAAPQRTAPPPRQAPPPTSSADVIDVEMPVDKSIKQNFISINVNKIDHLMNLVGEIVTTESMVTKSPDLANLKLEHFSKQVRHLRKLTNELQDIVMSIRMVPISVAFNKMQRVVRDMCRKIGKDVELCIIGETTEVDKNVIDLISDPLMHLIRNSMDHGLESAEERLAVGKPAKGTIILEAYNTGGDVIVSISDDGRGLNKSAIAHKAYEMGLTDKAEYELSDSEAYSFILEPGFSTNSEITEYSGRGVGMDVVRRNIESINGSITIDSKPGEGITNKIHIPLTLSIVEGMVVCVGSEHYIIPILSIRESFVPNSQKIFVDPNGVEMVIIRDECYRVLRLGDIFNVYTDIVDYSQGIMVMIQTEVGAAGLFVDKLIGEQQAVIKPIPDYITKKFGRVKGISGCTVLGDGSISMILDTNALINIK